ncbi:hypothetical protein F5Y09DRAFT_344550 [Xylaria sp. FL1042]|nr:hypothetical protein F5Y09DRAFT_344550 [Xylaria sp. FL1042]
MRAQPYLFNSPKSFFTAITLPRRFTSTQPKAQNQNPAKDHDVTLPNPPPETRQDKKTKTTAEMDEELKQKMSGIAGDGGEAGIEYEDGQPVAMKRSSFRQSRRADEKRNNAMVKTVEDWYYEENSEYETCYTTPRHMEIAGS